MADGRRVTAYLKFNGHNVTKSMSDYIENVTYTDVSSGSSDSIDIEVRNDSLLWMKNWYPTKGDRIEGGLLFERWDSEKKDKDYKFGKFILDDISFSGSSSTGTLSALSVPVYSSFGITKRTKTWKKVTIKKIVDEICKRYKLSYIFNASDYSIKSLEQSQKTDSDFLYSLAKDYGLKMKVFNSHIIIYDQTILQSAVAKKTVAITDFVDNSWSYKDTLYGTYTGATISYKSGKKKKKTVNISVGKTTGDNARVLALTNKCDSAAEASRMAKSKVNEANESMTKITGRIWPRNDLASGMVVNVKGFGRGSGKYFIDKIVINYSESGTSMNIEMHKCYKRL